MKIDLLKKKKMLLTYALAVSLSVSALTSCGNDTFSYTTDENGDLLFEGTIDFDEFKRLKLVHLTNKIALIDEYVLVREYDKKSIIKNLKYIDMETGEIIYDNLDDDFKNFDLEIIVDRMVDYLYKYDMVKDSYDIEDIKKLKESLLLDESLNIGRKMQEKENTKEEVRVLKRSKKYC